MPRIITLLALLVASFAASSGFAAADEWDDFEQEADDSPDAEASPISLHGFSEIGAGNRVHQDPTAAGLTLAEARFRLELEMQSENANASFKNDFVVDQVTGDLYLDVREAAIGARLTSWIDLRAGRQVLTWGTGDFVFLNDLFPKDWVAFFSGRDQAYLKAPSNSIKAAFFFPWANVDLVWTPFFTADRALRAERFSFFNPLVGSQFGPQSAGAPIDPLEPERSLDRGEFAARVYKDVSGYELAAYGYLGHWKQPNAIDLSQMAPTYARLAVYGASVRGALLGGIFNAEGSFFHSYRDGRGDNPTRPNSQLRWLAGYEHELATKLTGSAQYYAEYTLQHDTLVENSLWADYEQSEIRHVASLRLSYQLLQDNLTLSLFALGSPNERDLYLRPVLSYQWSDALAFVLGANLMWGDQNHTFIGQLEDNNNVYTRVRYTF